jgi:hypothetical protein
MPSKTTNNNNSSKHTHKYAPPTTAGGASLGEATAASSGTSTSHSNMEDLPSWDAYGDDSEDHNQSSRSGSNSNSGRSTGGGGGGGGRKKKQPLEMTGTSRDDNGTSSADMEQADAAMDEDLPRIILMTRLANLGMSLLLILVSLGQVIGFPAFSTWILSCYALCGACLICLLETQLKFLRVAIALNFGFLFSTPLRFLFYVLLSTLSWGAFGFLGRVVALGLLCVAFFNAYVLWRYPSYRAIRERIAEEEDKLIEAKVSSEIKQQAVSSIFGSATAAASSAYSAATGGGNSNGGSSSAGAESHSKSKHNKNGKKSNKSKQQGNGASMSVGSFT